MQEVDEELIKRIKEKYPDCPKSRKALRDAADVMNRNVRLKIKESIQECGYLAVLLVLASTIRAEYDYDPHIKAIAMQIPLCGNGYYANWHQAYVQELFLQEIKTNLV